MSETAEWATRIVDHGEQSPDTLIANPRNWRLHSERQHKALTEAMDRVGWVQSVIVNRRTGHLVDGHLRVGLALAKGAERIPVDYVDLSEDEERMVLATLDPLSSLAGPDEAALQGLLSDLDNGLEGELAKLMSDVGSQTGSLAPKAPTQDEIDRRDEELQRQQADRAPNRMFEVTCPNCGNNFAINLDEVGR